MNLYVTNKQNFHFLYISDTLTDLSIVIGSTSARLDPILCLSFMVPTISLSVRFIGSSWFRALAMLFDFLLWKCSSSLLEPEAEEEVLELP